MKCPHCLIHFHDQWHHLGIRIRDREASIEIEYTTCSSCKRLIIQMKRETTTTPFPMMSGLPIVGTPTMVYPKASARPVPQEVDKRFASDFKEAALVLSDSGKASAALSRRCLQALLREKARTKSKDLASQIQEVLDSGKLPPYLAEEIDAIRVTGNFAAHPTKSTNTGEVIEVSEGEAEANLNILEGLFDFYFVQPALAAKRTDALNAKLKDAGKPELKKPKKPMRVKTLRPSRK